MQSYNSDFSEENHFSDSENIAELELILNGITEPLVLIDPKFTIKRANLSALEFAKENSKPEDKCYQILYRRDDVCPYCPFVKHDVSLTEFDDVFENKNIEKTIEREIFFKLNKKTETLFLSFFPLIKNNKIYAVVEKISNITGIKEKDEETLRMRNLASIGVLVSGVAHELNNPLTGIGLTVQNLINNLESNDLNFFRKRLDMIQKDLSRASIIVSDILSFAKPGKITKTYSNIGESIYSAKETVERLYPVLSKEIRWQVECDSGLFFYFNPVKIERLFLNLFRNSIQAFDYKKGTIKVEVRKTKKWYHIFVEDDAGGISPEILDKIFDPFFTTNKYGGGTGLGLSICYSIVQEHDGSISVKSFDKKTRFFISLPAGIDFA
ncbi:MAG: HAMP domain-containing histidine kinase [Leptospiraceae bacterium]|nr:HAMP domain-containing histidine kinase [Leptospiraceae bacterium]MCK6379783.1 HAMP domain-containing histidine kinase [Leptospiraceae bacterium]NUM42287.1 HAMP domain-containing histidine kinase [Leptospiraceae bacterium]